MAENSKIQWTHHTFNPWRGCTKISPGCAHCYAETLSKRNPSVLGIWGNDGERVIASESMWREPLKWNRAAKLAGERHRVFCASLADVFEDRPELVSPRLRLFGLIRDTEHLDWLLLTKRPENIRKLWPSYIIHDSKCEPRQQRWTTNLELGIAAHNIWLGVSVETQDYMSRLTYLAEVPARVKFVSAEPLLGPLVFNGHHDGKVFNWLGKHPRAVQWVITGCESGGNRREFNQEWDISIQQQCATAGVAFFRKQIVVNGRVSGEVDEWPEYLRVREFPQ